MAPGSMWLGRTGTTKPAGAARIPAAAHNRCSARQPVGIAWWCKGEALLTGGEAGAVAPSAGGNQMAEVPSEVNLTCPVCGGKWTARGWPVPEHNRVMLMQFPTHALTLDGRPCAGGGRMGKPE